MKFEYMDAFAIATHKAIKQQRARGVAGIIRVMPCMRCPAPLRVGRRGIGHLQCIR
ncbi:hypothetical protein HAX54_037692, partial [Datura stramonium]|nr:hypothetical protein [Datura stramonium]